MTEFLKKKKKTITKSLPYRQAEGKNGGHLHFDKMKCNLRSL